MVELNGMSDLMKPREEMPVVDETNSSRSPGLWVIVLLGIILFVGTGAYFCDELSIFRSPDRCFYWHKNDWMDTIYISNSSYY